MRKTIYSLFIALMIVSLIVGFVSCDDGGDDNVTTDKFPSDFPENLIALLEGLGVDSFIAPVGGTYVGWAETEVFGLTYFYIAWSGCDQTKFNNYKAAWEAKLAAEATYRGIVEQYTINGMAIAANISLQDEADEIVGLSYPAYSILFMGNEKGPVIE